ncbi:MAG: putative sulfate exporter family transporter, partial [Gemmatimonadota bacterium]|nr:putative sulfate exporter family transporter [Gemmatimonadota bacterium]
VATVVKLARICLLAPVVFWLAWWLPRHHTAAGTAKVSAIPWFLLMFVVFAGVNSTGVIPEETLTLLRRADLWLLCVGMAGVGLQTGLGDLRAAGARPLVAGLLQWIVLAVMSLGLAMLAVGR